MCARPSIYFVSRVIAQACFFKSISWRHTLCSPPNIAFVRPHVLFGTTGECRDSPGNLGWLRLHEMRCTTSPRATAFKRICREELGSPIKVSPGVPVPECFIFGTSALAFSATACLVSWLPGYLCAPAFSALRGGVVILRVISVGIAFMRCAVLHHFEPHPSSAFAVNTGPAKRFPRVCLYRNSSSVPAARTSPTPVLSRTK